MGRSRPARRAAWRGDALAEFQIWRGRTPGSLTDVEDAFTGAAQREAARGRRARLYLQVGAFAFLAIALGVVGLFAARAVASGERAVAEGERAESEKVRAESEKSRAVQSLVNLYEEQGRLELLANRPGRALVYLAEAKRNGADSFAFAMMLADGARSFESVRFTLRPPRTARTDVQLWSIAYSSDERRLVSAGMNGNADVWDAESGKHLVSLVGHKEGVWRAAFSPDDTKIATASYDGTARIWDSGGRLLVTVAPKDWVMNAVFSPDGTKLATTSGDLAWNDPKQSRGTAEIWDVRTGERLRSLDVKNFTNRIAWSRDGTRVVTATLGRNVAEVWEVTTGKLLVTLAGHQGGIVRVAYSPDETRIATASDDHSAFIYEAATGLRRLALGHDDRVRHLEWSPDGKTIATASFDKTARIWDAETGALRATLRGHDGPVYTVGFAPGGDRIVTAGADGIVRIWNPSGALLALRAGHNDSIYSAVFRRDGARIATASWDGTARVWVTEPDSLVRSATSDKKLSSVDVARDGHIVTASEDGSATVWNADLSPARSLPARGVHAAFSPDGTRIVTAEANHVARVWRVSDGAVVQSLVGHQQEVFCARFSASGDRIATASRDGTARLWDATGQTAKLDHGRSQVTWAAFGPAGEVVTTSHDDAGIRVWSTSGGHTPALQSLDVTFRIEYSRDGRHAVALHGRGSDNATVWEVSTGKPLGTLSHTDRIVGARFSPDGAFVATASRDHAVRIWDARRFKLLRVLMGHTDDATDVAFENDTDLLTVGYDGSLRRWRIEQDRRSLRELDDLVRCRVGWGLDANGVLTRRSPDVCD